MTIPDDKLSAALRALLRLTTGFYVGFAGMPEIGQLENLNYWVESKDHKGVKLWYKDDIPLEEAISHFLRIRRERELGYDIEIDLNPELGHIGPRELPLAEPVGEPTIVPSKRVEEYGEVCDVLIRLMDEGTDAFRLTKGVQLGPERFQLLGTVPPGEKWEFQPGEVVRCIIKVLGSNEAHWFAVKIILAERGATPDTAGM